ncbi:MAG: M23 family metallopeptidase [Okeania sp. SIO3B3]|nr:M23 family metallopeptidase [Okeania sp. SIO3B3]
MKRLLILLVLLMLLAAGAAAFVLFSSGTPPQIALAPTQGAVGPATEFQLTVSAPQNGLKRIVATVRQEQTSRPLVREVPAVKPGSYSTVFTLPADALQDGQVQVDVEAVDASYSNMAEGARATASFTFVLDKNPPILSVLSQQHNLNQGGSGLVMFTANEELQLAEVRVGDRAFPAYKLPDGRFAGLFAFPYYVEKADFSPTLHVVDIAGNTTSRGFPFFANARKFKRDTIRLPDSFLQRKMPEFSSQHPGITSPLDVFLKVNRETRHKNRQALLDIGSKSASIPLWSGSFLRLPNSATRAGFAEYRDYKHNGKTVDEQVHLGVDLASLKHAKVPAANNGVVVHANYLGIYGNCVIVDHGLGLMTLYAHLSSMEVAKGQQVERGQILGRTGTSGMAGGDHLHYGVLAAGLPVNPLEWWDQSWIENNISGKLRGEQ